MKTHHLLIIVVSLSRLLGDSSGFSFSSLSAAKTGRKFPSAQAQRHSPSTSSVVSTRSLLLRRQKKSAAHLQGIVSLQPLAFQGTRPTSFCAAATCSSSLIQEMVTNVAELAEGNEEIRDRASLPRMQQQQQQQRLPHARKNEAQIFQDLCRLMDATPVNLLRLDVSSSSTTTSTTTSDSNSSVRGIYLNQNVSAGGVILSIPVAACLADNHEPPAWMTLFVQDDADDVGVSYNNPSDWATRLAASLLDKQYHLSPQTTTSSNNPYSEAHKLWMDLLPDPRYLRASLPIHWSSEIKRSAGSTALELATDSAYFARAEAVSDLLQGITENVPSLFPLSSHDKVRLVENALDVVQTRTCRIESTLPGEQPIRLLAPIFDMINHGGLSHSNAAFALEENRLVVRATRDVHANEEVLIDYGDAARPDWKCLVSYGFVPVYNQGDELKEEYAEVQHTAEVYIDGIRYEVGPSTIPTEMVAHYSMLNKQQQQQRMTTLDDDDVDDTAAVDMKDVVLTPEVAVQLAQRLSSAAFQLLLNPESDPSSKYDDDDNDNEKNDHGNDGLETVIASQHAAFLRWNQHRILLACAVGLGDWAVEQQRSSTLE